MINAHRGWMRSYVLASTVACAFLVITGDANAQSSGFSANSMWGTGSGSSNFNPSFTDSAIMHSADGSIAGQVNAAQSGLLLNNGGNMSLSVYSIGSQSVVSNTIIGNNNSTDITANQSASNSGSVSNSGAVSSTPATR